MSGPTSTKVMDGAGIGQLALHHAGAPLPVLRQRLWQLLDDSVYGLCFSAYLPGQSPERASQLSADQVRERLQLVAPHCRWVRTFSCTDGNEHAPRIAHELGLKTLVGAWLGPDQDKNEREIHALVEVARAGHVDVAAVGNEVLYRGDLTVDQLLAWIRRVKQALPGLPVGYVDAYYEFLEHPELVGACDQLLVNCYPFWEEFSLEAAVPAMREMVRRVQAVAGDKPVVVTETGWPTGGTPVGAAVPSEDNALVYALEVLEWAGEQGLPIFYFAAFDEDWKTGPEGDRGSSWGFWDTRGRPKHRP